MASFLIPQWQVVPLGQTAYCQVTILQNDAFTKVGGQTLVPTLWLNGVEVSSPVVAVTEPTTGDYVASFTPDRAGQWVLELRCDAQFVRARLGVLVPGILGASYYGELRDDQGRPLPYCLVEVLDGSDHSTVITTAETDRDGRYVIALSGSLVGGPLVDLRFSGPNLVTRTQIGMRLS